MTVKTETRMEEVDVAIDVICNACGKSMGVPGQGINFSAHWGYASKYDMQQWTGDLCEQCSDEFEQWILSRSGHVDKMMCTVDGEPICSLEEYEKRLDEVSKNDNQN